MEREVQAFIDAVADDEVQHFDQTATQQQFYADPVGAVAPLATFVRKQIEQDQLAQAELQITDAEVSVRLELSVINLPLKDTKTIAKIMATDSMAIVNVNAVIEAPAINVSKLRIDALAPAATFVDQAATADQSLADWLKLQVEKLQAAATNTDEDPE